MSHNVMIAGGYTKEAAFSMSHWCKMP